MESTISIEQFREELQSWKHELSSIKQEIRHFERHLEHLALSRLPREVLAQIEHFQNLFICQKEVIDKLRHDLPDSGNKVENIFNSLRSIQLQQASEAMTEGLEERMHTFRKIYTEIKQDFRRFDPE
jgi:archaellum component FlaC